MRNKAKLLRKMYLMEDELERLAWYILVNKILYYYSDLFSDWEPVNDRAYDEFEKAYLKLCQERGVKNEFVHKEYPEYPGMATGMMEVDFNHPKVQEVVAFMKECYG